MGINVFRLSYSLLCASIGASLTSIFVGLTGHRPDEYVTLQDLPSLRSPLASAKTLVVYTGPTSLDPEKGKNDIYLTNFDYFLDNGIDCQAQDTVLVLSPQVAERYQPILNDLRLKCQSLSSSPHPIRVMEREDRCYDMESLRLLFEKISLVEYEHMVYVNCGVVGPKLPSNAQHETWTNRYISMLSDKVKMAGLTINCEFHPHVQSMVFAVDRIGLEIIRNSGAVYDCGMKNEDIDENQRKQIIQQYEIGMSKAILEAGYGIRSSHGSGPTEVQPADVAWIDGGNTCKDYWYPKKGRFYSWEDLMFFKTTRMFMLPEIQEELEYDYEDEFTFVVPAKQEKELHNLWIGNSEGGDPHRLSITVIVSHCKHSLDWLEPYLMGFNVRVVVVSKCGHPVDKKTLPKGSKVLRLPNTGRCDHTMAYIMSKVSEGMEHMTEEELNSIGYVFLKDNYDLHQLSNLRSFYDMLRITETSGFACFQEPAAGLSQWHRTSVLQHFNMTDYCGVPFYDENGELKCRFSSEYFKSDYKNLGEWVQDMGITLPTPFTNVCYGGMYSVLASQIMQVPTQIFKNIQTSLERHDNIEEGHFAERLWAAILSKPLEADQAKMIGAFGSITNYKVARDGGGELGVLISGSHSLSQARRRHQRKERQ